MLQNLLDLVKGQANEVIVNNPAIPNERNEEAISMTGNAITGGLQDMLSSGGLKDVLSLFGQRETANSGNPVVQNVSGNLVSQLMERFGLDAQSAGGIAGNLVPNVLQQLVGRTNDPSDSSFDIQSVFNQLSGGRSQGMDIQGMLSRIKLDVDGDGDTDMQDMMALLSGKGQGGNLLDNVKGLFGR
ncbi:MAG: hypothetical protein P0Y53_07305 [Candidatus Pseudobacter hemicellulosilyticus]|uniref:DUF937 domain-containing protein n=1 Tax=Candidatus Pseudobacter hemicellulosilyticus TaxID=3121375 RepID=A0AAJ5WXG3_9BACT|nr:MAG: hypothetical protein P0Y53_07305 [Pseudobacter sp.]